MKGRGFTLAESLVGIFILAVGLLGLMVMLIFAQRAERQAATDYQVSAHARSLMAGLVGNLRLSGASFQVSQSCGRVPLDGYKDIEYRVDEQRLAGTRSKKLRLTIYYKNQQGKPCETTFFTEVYNAIED